MPNSPRRAIHRSSPYYPTPSSRLFSSSTFTYIASWRGQLLICTVVMVLGFIYFIIREPLDRWRRSRREMISRVRAEELVRVEEDTKDDEEKEKEEIREKEKSARERGREKRKEVKKKKGGVQDVLGEIPTPGQTSLESSPIPKTTSSPRAKRAASNAKAVPPPLKVHLRVPTEEHLQSVHPQTKAAREPWEIPLPDSPIAGPSRLAVESSNGDSLDESELSAQPDQSSQGRGSSDGWSILPDEGWLPKSITALASSAKKKKKKAKAEAGPRADAESLPDRSREMEQLIASHAKTVDSLRAEIGTAKAEEGRAKEDAKRSKITEEKVRGELDKARRGRDKLEVDARRREIELQTRLNQLSQAHGAALHRIGALEAIFRDAGHSPLPPPSPIPHQPFQAPTLSPFPPPSSPFPNHFAPSYPSPGMYPSPMLHPSHVYGSHSPTPFRRPSSVGVSEVSLAGPLTPGLNHPPSPHPLDVGNGIMPSPSLAYQTHNQLGLGRPTSPQTQTAADLRRISIESSVLKKKVKAESASPEPQPMIEEEVEGLGMGAVGISSPSPKGQILTTPANSELYHPPLPTMMNGIQCVPDGDRGNVYSLKHQDDDGTSVSEDEQEDPSTTNTSVSLEEGEYRPLFASLAHTPEQLLQIKRMREQALKERERGRKRTNGVINGPLTPSPSKSPVPLKKAELGTAVS